MARAPSSAAIDTSARCTIFPRSQNQLFAPRTLPPTGCHRVASTSTQSWPTRPLTPIPFSANKHKKVALPKLHPCAQLFNDFSDALHATRLLQVEERPCQRVTRNLLGKEGLLRSTLPRQLPSPPPDSDDQDQDVREASDDQRRRAKFREDILLDFAALESSILRIQLVQSSNARERERYAAAKAKILATAQAVRDNTISLRGQLAEAQNVLEQRKGYDMLAQKLIFDKKLKPRADALEDIGTLEKEIEDLEQEGAEYDGVWEGRREAWNRVVSEGQNLVKVVRGIKDEPEERVEDGDEGIGGKEERSQVGTPVPEGSTPAPVLGDGSTPMHLDASTPQPEEAGSPAPPTNKFLDIDDHGTRNSSRVQSPMLQPTRLFQSDTDMEEASGGDGTQLDHPEADDLQSEALPADRAERSQEQEMMAQEGDAMDES